MATLNAEQPLNKIIDTAASVNSKRVSFCLIFCNNTFRLKLCWNF